MENEAESDPPQVSPGRSPWPVCPQAPGPQVTPGPRADSGRGGGWLYT